MLDSKSLLGMVAMVLVAEEEGGMQMVEGAREAGCELEKFCVGE